MKTYVNFSMGVCSAYIACRLQDECQSPICVFSDTGREDEDTYRFGREVAERWGLQVIEASAGIDLWDWFRANNMIPARQYPACSIALKIKPSQKFYDSAEPGRIAYGYDLGEEDRAERTRSRWSMPQHTPWFPMLEWGVSKEQAMGYFLSHRVEVPRMYRHFLHANCLPCKNFQKYDWIALMFHYPDKFQEAKRFEAESGLRWMQDGPTLSELEVMEVKARKRKRKLAMETPAFSFDMGCDACAVG